MTRAECKYCEQGYYKDGKCYADRRRTGRPVEEYTACDWARKESNKKNGQYGKER